MKTLIVMLVLAAGTFAQTRYDRLYAVWERNPDSIKAYDRRR
jgi:hypothetical protein